MLAYVFWHRPDGSLAPSDYERRLAAFHERLRADPPPGFAGSAAFRVTGLDWLGDGYEDWYLVADWDALGVLNAAAVDAVHGRDHDAVAGHAGDGAGGVYSLRAGTLPIADGGTATWLAKPRGAAYPDWEEQAAGGRDPGAFALWQRQLVLGPAREYCLLTRGDARVRVAGA